MLPFRLVIQPGTPVHEQVTFAAKKAILSGRLRPGDPFPSVRTLSGTLRINPNTAQKAVAQLQAEGFLEVRPGIGTVVAPALPPPAPCERARLLGRELEQIVVEGRRLGLTLDEVQAALAEQWGKLDKE